MYAEWTKMTSQYFPSRTPGWRGRRGGVGVSGRSARLPWVRGVFIVAVGSAAVLWAASYFSAEARVRRAMARLIALAEKSEAESSVAAGLAAHRFGQFLAADVQLEVEGWKELSRGRQELIQLFVQVRDYFDAISFPQPEITTLSRESGEVTSFIRSAYRLEAAGIAPLEGEGRAEVQWRRGDEGWQIVRAILRPDPRQMRWQQWP